MKDLICLGRWRKHESYLHALRVDKSICEINYIASEPNNNPSKEKGNAIFHCFQPCFKEEGNIWMLTCTINILGTIFRFYYFIHFKNNNKHISSKDGEIPLELIWVKKPFSSSWIKHKGNYREGREKYPQLAMLNTETKKAKFLADRSKTVELRWQKWLILSQNMIGSIEQDRSREVQLAESIPSIMQMQHI